MISLNLTLFNNNSYMNLNSRLWYIDSLFIIIICVLFIILKYILLIFFILSTWTEI